MLYHVSSRQAFIWPYDSQARLAGEHLYEDKTSLQIEEVDPSEAITPDRPLLQVPFPRMTFEEAIERFGSDKPDIRFGMELVDLAPALVDESGAAASGFTVFDSTLAAGGRVKAIVAPGMAGATRREIDDLTESAKRFGAKGLAHLAIEPDGSVKGPIAKFLSESTQAGIVTSSGAAVGDLILIVADTAETTADVLGRLRVELGARLELADPLGEGGRERHDRLGGVGLEGAVAEAVVRGRHGLEVALGERRENGEQVGHARLRDRVEPDLGLAVGHRRLDPLGDDLRVVEQEHRAVGERLAHLRRGVLQVHHPGPEGGDGGLGHDERVAVTAVEPDGEVARELEVLALIVAEAAPSIPLFTAVTR